MTSVPTDDPNFYDAMNAHIRTQHEPTQALTPIPITTMPDDDLKVVNAEDCTPEELEDRLNSLRGWGPDDPQVPRLKTLPELPGTWVERLTTLPDAEKDTRLVRRYADSGKPPVQPQAFEGAYSVNNAAENARRPVIEVGYENIYERHLRRLATLAIDSRVPQLHVFPPDAPPVRYVELSNTSILLRHAVAEAFTAGAAYALSLQPPAPILIKGPPLPAHGHLGSPCCDLHNQNCEPPGDLCCRWCVEYSHPQHADGSLCVLPAPTQAGSTS